MKMVTPLIIFSLFVLCNAVSEVELVHSIEKLENEVRNLEHARDHLKKQISILSSQLDTGARNLDKAAFSVTLAADTTVSHDTIVVFDRVITDNLGNYNPTFGFFECPETGMYFFSVTLVSPEPASAYLRLGTSQNIMDVTTYTADENQTGAHTNSVVVQCPAGETVAVLAYNPSGESSYTGNYRTIFSGYYI